MQTVALKKASKPRLPFSLMSFVPTQGRYSFIRYKYFMAAYIFVSKGELNGKSRSGAFLLCRVYYNGRVKSNTFTPVCELQADLIIQLCFDGSLCRCTLIYIFFL